MHSARPLSMPTRRCLWTLFATVVHAAPAAAIDYAGHVNAGVFSAHEKDSTPFTGSDQNDSLAAFGSLYFDAAKIWPYKNQFTLDLRDKYDYFAGALDANGLRLIPSNEPQLRQLAVKHPYDQGSYYWALGRFPIADAAVLGNDGVDVGIKAGAKIKIGAFAGLFPEQRHGQTLQLAKEDHQAGAYAQYQDQGPDWQRSTYASTALVLRQPVSAVQPPGTYIERAQPLPDGATTQQSEAADSALPLKNYLFWYSNIVHQPSEQTRFTYLSHVDVEPSVHLRNLWASAYHQWTARFSGTLAALRIDSTEYKRQRDLRDILPASAYTEGRADARFKLDKGLMLEGVSSIGVRGSDQKNAASVNAKLVATNLQKGRFAAFAGAGYRKSFISHDLIARFGASYFTAKVDVDFTQLAMIEHRDNGETLHPLIFDLSLTTMLSTRLVGSLTFELAKDEKALLTSALMTLGYRFGSRQLTPTRERAPRLERL